ncbi:M24 family metallopeptidase [Desulfofustis glycolicus]|uniref:Xaa-Pro dipeptidase n=1 Tax=Desulfofustis glycolicus DSM 9705 TaxID=1121409 RepID=A0A1M5SI52_9BACT|nr:M24 family metallopeptidase [Desulfofustis glycolicus]SHH38169.1 Xaa-Pro dipeptidase [Desulfofustis glycolicus DSM 9705]
MTLFKEIEYRQRIDLARERMSEAAIEVLVVSDPANMNYLTGYDGWSFYTPQCLVLAIDEATPLWIGRGMDAAGARHTTFLPEERVIGYPDRYVHSPHCHPLNFVGDVIRERGWGARSIGVEMDAYYFTARSFAELQNSLPDARFVTADLLVNWIRLIKSEAEIELMRQAGQIANRVMTTAIERLEPGVRECDVVADVYRAQMSGTPEYGGDYPAIVPMMPTGEKTSAPHLTWTDEPYRSEQMVNLELAACRHRYHCPIARTAYLGKRPPAPLVELAEHTVEGLNLTLAAIRPGLRAEEVELVWRNHIAKAGLEKESRIGYSMGLNYPPDWGEHTVSLRPGDKTILQPNMTFHMILGMWMDTYGFECSESFRVTDKGCETFADVPRKLFVKG